MILETDRLYLREMNQNDYGALCKILQDEEVLDREEVFSIIRDTNTASQNVAVRNGMEAVDHWVKHYRGVDMPNDRYIVTR